MPGAKITFLAMLPAILAFSQAAAQEALEEDFEDFEQLYLGELLQPVVTAAKHQQELAESPSAISVITRDQIENTHCLDVACLLRLVPEMDVKEITPMFTSVGARALTDALGDKVLVLVDGRAINSEAFGIPVWQLLSVHLEDIERIEVIRGPGSALYGANAHSGVISIITRRPDQNRATVFVGGGEHNRVSAHLRLDHSLEKLKVHLSGGGETSDHWRIQGKRDREMGRACLVLEHRGDYGRLFVDAGITDFAGTIYTTLAPLDVGSGQMAHAVLGHEADWIKSQVTFSLLNVQFSFDMLPLMFGPAKIGEPPEGMDILTTALDVDTQLNWSPFSGNLLIGGVNYRWDALFSDDNYPGTINQHRVGVFVHDEQRIGERLILTAGVRLDYNTISPPSVSPRLAGVFQFQPGQFLRLAGGMAFRKPSFFNTSVHIKGFQGEEAFPELEQFFLDNLGNPDVKNERITTLELGYIGRFLDNRLTAEAVAFYNRYRNTMRIIVDLQEGLGGIPNLSASSMKFESAGREVDTLGGSVSVSYKLKESFRVSLNYTYRYSWFVSEPGGATAEVGEGHKGDRVAWEPAHLFNAWFYYLFANGLRLGASVHAESASDMAKTEHGGPFDDYVLLRMPARFVLSGFAAWRIRRGFGWWEMGVRAYNALNQGFRDNGAVVRPDGSELGGELIGRRIFFFVRGTL